MNPVRRWDPCVFHRGESAETFCIEYFGDNGRKLLLIAGAGFDPRSSRSAELITTAASGRADGLFLREERANPDAHLVEGANANERSMKAAIPGARVERCDVFADDGAVIGGRRAMKILSEIDLSVYTDVIADMSALSVGISFPILRYLLERAAASKAALNVHALVLDNAGTDSSIQSRPCDRTGPVQGFQGNIKTDAASKATKLWVPQLIEGKSSILDMIYKFVEPHDVCPVLPFPSADPRRCDALFEHFADEFESVWEVDSRSVLYADERNPLDLYRTILRIDDARQRVFTEVGGSMVVLSPLGTKAMALGCLMAAVERGLPVVYVESIGYSVDFAIIRPASKPSAELVHVWLAGDAYPQTNE